MKKQCVHTAGKEKDMARLDMEEYRSKYLRVIEDHLLNDHSAVPNFTTSLLSDAIREELNMRADPETWSIEVDDDFDKAICDAEERIIGIMVESKDLGMGKTS
jgi:hypothetical protein